MCFLGIGADHEGKTGYTKSVAALTLDRGQSEAFVWDADLAGFGLRLQGQRRTYVVQYRTGGRTRRVTLGSTDRLTPTQARDGARKILARVALGEDPQGDKVAQRGKAERTFQKVVEAYLKVKQSEWRPQSFKVATLYLTGAYFRPLHPMAINEITHPDVAARLTAITNKHSSPTAAAARRAISALFRWALEEGWCAANPVVGTRKPADSKAREHVLSDADLAAIWRACGDDDFGRIVRLLILLGSRRQEVGGLVWSELNLAAGTWTLPAARSKNHHANTIALSAPAIDIIRAVPYRGRVQLFGERSERGFTLWSHEKAELERRLGDAVGPFRIHDIRRTVATRMADIGIEPHIVEAILNHYSGHRAGVGGIYNRSPYARAVKAALARWAEHVLALVEGRPSNVVAFSA